MSPPMTFSSASSGSASSLSSSLVTGLSAFGVSSLTFTLTEQACRQRTPLSRLLTSQMAEGSMGRGHTEPTRLSAAGWTKLAPVVGPALVVGGEGGPDASDGEGHCGDQ